MGFKMIYLIEWLKLYNIGKVGITIKGFVKFF